MVKLINVLNDYFHSILTNEKFNSLLNLDPSLSHPNLNQIIVTSLGVQKLLESLTVNKASGPQRCANIYSKRAIRVGTHPGFIFSDQDQLPNDWIKAKCTSNFEKGEKIFSKEL